MYTRARTSSAGLIGLGIFGLLGAGAPAVASSHQPAPDPTPVLFLGVSAHSPTDAWAVGSAQGGNVSGVATHWDGTTWTRTPVPHPGDAGVDELEAVATLSPTDAWAVGYYYLKGISRNMILHWDGSGWAKVKSPHSSDTQPSILEAVTAISPTDVWAVGQVQDLGELLFFHWDGANWTKAPVPRNRKEPSLVGVSGSSAADVWAVGGYNAFVQGDQVHRTLIEHWDGTGWTTVPSPNPGGRGGTFLRAVSSTSATNAWAVGDTYDALTERFHTVILHWDGTSWTTQAGPVDGGFLSGVSAVSGTDAWAVGTSRNAAGDRRLLLHWDGASWTRVRSAGKSIDPGLTYPSAVSADSANDAWAVGYGHVHYDGTRWGQR